MNILENNLKHTEWLTVLNSVLFALFISLTLLTGFISPFFPVENISLYIAVILFLASICINQKVPIKYTLLISTFSLYLLINILIFNNFSSKYYFFNFLLNGVIMTYIINFKFNSLIIMRALIWIGCFYYVIILPFVSIGYSATAMQISYSLLPAILSIIYFIFNKYLIRSYELIIYGILLIILLNFLLFNGNRGAIFSVLIYVILNLIIKLKSFYFKILFSIAILFNLIYIFINSEEIFIRLHSFLYKRGYSFEWLDRSIRQINSEVGILSNRDDLYTGAYQLFKDKPLLGIGIGEFENIYGIYSHNLLLQLLLEFGIIGAGVIIFIILKGIKESFFIDKNKQSLMLLLFSLSIPQLMFSNTIWLSNTFWMYFLFAILIISTKKKVKVN